MTLEELKIIEEKIAGLVESKKYNNIGLGSFTTNETLPAKRQDFVQELASNTKYSILAAFDFQQCIDFLDKNYTL